MFPNETPWPGLNYRTADLMPGLRREFQKNDRLATHTALGELFIPDEFGKCKRVFAESRQRLPCSVRIPSARNNASVSGSPKIRTALSLAQIMSLR